MRIPWFKKFANPAYDNIQPTLGISKASDVDTFRQPQFKSTAKNADKQGDPNIFGPLYEDFGRKALQLVNQSNIFGELVRGSVLQSKAISDQTAFDNAFKLVNETIAMDFKGFPKNNLSGGSIAKHMTDKYNRVLKTDPEQAAKIKEAIMIFNEPGHENQLPSEFGKNFIQLAGTSYSQMLKNTPNFVKELSNETNMLLERYVKNPQFLKMNAAGGFIPNFGNLDVGARSMLVNSGITPFVVDLQRKTMAASSAGDDMFHSQIVNKKFVDPVTGKPIYPKLYDDDIHSAAWKDIFVRGFVDSGTGKVSFDLTEPQKKDKNFMQKHSALLEIVKTKYAEKFKSAIPMKPKRVSPLAAFRSGGFIPNFVDFIDVDTLGKNSVHYSGDLMKLIKDIEASIGRNLSAGE
ncbi:MAG: hypothetical protein EBZ21_08420, partial [Flavobacteriia bacterium]|nr:hypothetical protein [Flavobacteriia bacterium]